MSDNLETGCRKDVTWYTVNGSLIGDWANWLEARDMCLIRETQCNRQTWGKDAVSATALPLTIRNQEIKGTRTAAKSTFAGESVHRLVIINKRKWDGYLIAQRKILTDPQLHPPLFKHKRPRGAWLIRHRRKKRSRKYIRTLLRQVEFRSNVSISDHTTMKGMYLQLLQVENRAVKLLLYEAFT